MKRRWLLLLLCVSCFSIETCTAQITISLKSDFVTQFQDTVTIDASFRVDVFSAVHTAKQDGDIHVAGTAPEIGLLAVAEVMNAKTERNGAVKTLTSAKGSDTPVAITGAWRIWSEHGGDQDYHQGADVPVATSSGQAHVFEIHPVTKVNGRDVSHTLELFRATSTRMPRTHSNSTSAPTARFQRPMEWSRFRPSRPATTTRNSSPSY